MRLPNGAKGSALVTEQHTFLDDPDVFTFAMHQQNLYPVKQRSSLDIGLGSGTGDDQYLALLRQWLWGRSHELGSLNFAFDGFNFAVNRGMIGTPFDVPQTRFVRAANSCRKATTMARSARVVVPGAAHHITQRGTRRYNVFGDPADRDLYLALFEQACWDFELDVLAYCLMTNHVHFVAIPLHETTIYKVFHRVHGVYAQHFNAKYDFVGHLWQDRPYSCVLDGPHVLNAVRYVERNPVRAGMVARAEDYSWSSAAAHCGLREDTLMASGFDDWPSVKDWSAWLAPPEPEEVAQRLRHCTLTGRPFGDDTFLQTVSRLTGRNLMRKKPGPKPRDSRPDRPGLESIE